MASALSYGRFLPLRLLKQLASMINALACSVLSQREGEAEGFDLEEIMN